MRKRQMLEHFLDALVHIEQAQLKVKHGFAGDAEQKMSWLDDAGMDRADRHLKNAFTFHRSELVTLALERRQHGFQVKILAQRMNLRPVVVQRTTARVGMTDQVQAEPILNLPLLPIHRRYGVGERGERRRLGRNRRAEDEKAMSGIERQDVVKVEDAVARADVIGEHHYQTRVPVPAKVSAAGRDQLEGVSP